MYRSKRIAAVGVGFALLAAMAGCSSNDSASKEISLWSLTDNGAMKAYVDDYNKAHPGTTVTLRQIPFANYDNTLQQAFSAGSGPDLAQINGTSFPAFASKGFLQPIDPIVGTSGTLSPSNFYPNLYNSGQYKDEQIVLPIDTGTRVLQYNKKLLAEAGVAPFGETVSWPDMLAAARKIQALGGDKQGFCYAGGEKWVSLNSNVGPFVVQAGGAFVNDDLTEATLDTPQVAKGFDFFKQLAATGDASNLVNTSTEQCVEQFGAGDVGMQFAGFWDIPSEDKITGDFELGQSLPKDETVYSSTGGWMLGVPNYVESDKFEAIKAFTQDMYEPKNIVKFTGIMPATKAGRDEATPLKAPEYQIYWDILNENADNPIPLNEGLVEQSIILMNTMQAVVQGNESIDSALKSANAQFDATLPQ